MKKNCFLEMALAGIYFLPLTASAVAEPQNFREAIIIAVDVVTAVLPVIVLLSFVYFLWGLTQYLKETGENKEEAKKIMVYGVIALFAMSTVWGFVAILTNTFGVESHQPSRFETITDTPENILEGTAPILPGGEEERHLGHPDYSDRDRSWSDEYHWER